MSQNLSSAAVVIGALRVKKKNPIVKPDFFLNNGYFEINLRHTVFRE